MKSLWLLLTILYMAGIIAGLSLLHMHEQDQKELHIVNAELRVTKIKIQYLQCRLDNYPTRVKSAEECGR